LENTPRFQLLARSSSYLEVARICVENGGNRSELRAPILHLVAQGIETLLKHVHVNSSDDLKNVRNKFRHDLIKLWQHDSAKAVRIEAYRQAKIAWEQARESGKYGDEFDSDPCDELDDYINKLSDLHLSTDLRYVLKPESSGPVPLLLVETFQPVTQEFLRRLSWQ